MSITQNSVYGTLPIDDSLKVSIPSLRFLKVDDCIIHPRRRRLRHVNGVYLRNLHKHSIQSQGNHQENALINTSITSSPIKIKRNGIKEIIYDLDNQLEDKQSQLQTLNNEKFLNVFFSLHFNSKNDFDKVFYVSEIVERSLNANFQEFNLESLIHSREQSFVLKVWNSNYANPTDWVLYDTKIIHLSRLLYLNKNINDITFDDSFWGKKNFILISLNDGIYLYPEDNDTKFIHDYQLVVSELDSLDDTEEISSSKFTVKSLTFDSIMKLNNLDNIIEDLQRSKFKLSKQIDELIKTVDPPSMSVFKIEKIKQMINLQKDLNLTKLNKLKRLQILKNKQKELINSNSLLKEKYSKHFQTVKEDYSSILINHENVSKELILERSKITKTVLSIFPKDEITEWLQLQHFDILPTDLNLNHVLTLLNNNSTNDTKFINELNAGFGYISHIVVLLSRYLAIPIRYQLQPFGSTSYVIDKISQINQRKIFPLFYTTHFHRFQYAIILLNMNIQDISREVYHY